MKDEFQESTLVESSIRASIIIPTYNSENHIRRTLGSVINQEPGTPDFELIVVDNGSNDNTDELLLQLADENDALRIYTESNRGAGAARNQGILQSEGRILIFLDDDIEVDEDHIKRHCKYHELTEYRSCLITEVVDRATYPSEYLERYVQARHSITAKRQSNSGTGFELVSQNFSIPRNLLERVRFERDNRIQYFDERFIKRQDGELGYRLISAGIKLELTDEIVCFHRHNYKQGDFERRAYWSGYYLREIYQKHPELEKLAPHIVFKNRLVNTFIRLAGKFVFGLGYVIKDAYPEIMFKGIGAQLLFYSSNGYMDADRRIRR